MAIKQGGGQRKRDKKVSKGIHGGGGKVSLDLGQKILFTRYAEQQGKARAARMARERR